MEGKHEDIKKKAELTESTFHPIMSISAESVETTRSHRVADFVCASPPEK